MQPDRRPGVSQFAGVRVVNFPEPLAGQELRRFQRLVHGEHRSARDAVFQAELQDFLFVVLHEPRGDQTLRFLRVLIAHRPTVPVARVVNPLRVAQQIQEPLVLLQLRRIDAHVTIPARQHTVGKQPQSHAVA